MSKPAGAVVHGGGSVISSFPIGTIQSCRSLPSGGAIKWGRAPLSPAGLVSSTNRPGAKWIAFSNDRIRISVLGRSTPQFAGLAGAVANSARRRPHLSPPASVAIVWPSSGTYGKYRSLLLQVARITGRRPGWEKHSPAPAQPGPFKLDSRRPTRHRAGREAFSKLSSRSVPTASDFHCGSVG